MYVITSRGVGLWDADILTAKQCVGEPQELSSITLTFRGVTHVTHKVISTIQMFILIGYHVVEMWVGFGIGQVGQSVPNVYGLIV